MPSMSESSSVTLVNSPNGTGCHKLPNDEFSRRRRKSVTFSAVAQIIHSGLADRSNIPSEIDQGTHTRPVPISNSRTHSQFLLDKTAVERTSRSTSQVLPSNSPHRPLVSSMARQSQYGDFPCDGLATNLDHRYPIVPSGTGPNPHFLPNDATFPGPFFVQPPFSPSKGGISAMDLPEPLQHPTNDHSHLSPSFPPRPLAPLLVQQVSHQCGHQITFHRIAEQGIKPQLYPPSEVPKSQQEVSFHANHVLRHQARQHDHGHIFDHPASQHAQPELHRHSQQLTSFFLTPNTIHLPPSHICAQVNNQVATTFNLWTFDFVEHIRRRKYVIRKHHFDASSRSQHCVAMLDMSVDLLFPYASAIPTPPPPFASPRELFDVRPAFASLPSHSPGIFKYKSKSNAISKGLGMFALLPIPANAAIVVERPVVIMPYVMALSTSLEEAFEAALRTLDDETRNAIVDLVRSPLTQEVKSVYQAVMKVSSLAIELSVPSKAESGRHGELETHKGIFLNTSRINHRFVFVL